MDASSADNKRIAKNTIYLYIRMILVMAVSLYTSRVVLDVLGVSDYGIYNAIGGIVVLISILNNSMSSATQRFITFELGKNDLKRVNDTFSMSMTAHIIICIAVLLLGETIGLYYVVNYLNVPPDRHTAAIWVYQISLATVVLNIIRVPYNATVIAYEKMGFFAISSIIDTLLKLVVVLILVFGPYDKLIFYTFLIFLISVVMLGVYMLYCKKSFKTCRYTGYMERTYFKELLGFFGWNFVGGVAVTGSRQIGNLIVNFFCGTVANAAYGVAMQVSNAIGGFASNFQLAYNPQIVKLYSQQRKEELFRLMNRSALLSYYLLFIISMPIFFNIDYVLALWLKEVPPFAGIFCQWLILYSLIDSVQAPLWMVISATGKIKTYEIWLNSLLILNIPFSYYCLKVGMPAYTVVIISTIINLVSAIIRTIHVKIQIGYPISLYLKEVVSRFILVTIPYIIFCFVFFNFSEIDTLFSFLIFFVCSVLLTLLLIYYVGLNRNDKRVVVEIVTNKIRGFIK